MADLSLFDFDHGSFDPGGFTHLSQLIERRALVAACCAHCRHAWKLGLPTLRHWLRARGDVPIAQLMAMRCQAGREGRGCGKRGVMLQWAVREKAPAFDQRVAWTGRPGRRNSSRHVPRGQGRLDL